MFKRILIPTLVFSFLAISLPAVAGENDAAKDYENAYELMANRQYKAAASAFRKFVKDYPKNKRTDDAAYWYCYSLSRGNEDMVQAFECMREFQKKYPNSGWSEEAEREAISLAAKLYRKTKDPKYRALLMTHSAPEVPGQFGHDAPQPPNPPSVHAEEHAAEAIARDVERETRAMQRDIEREVKSALRGQRGHAHGDSDEELRLLAIMGLLESGEEVALDELIAVYRSAKREHERRLIIYTIGETEDERAIPLLVEVLKNERNVDIRRHAAYALVEFDHDPRVLDALVDMVKNNPPNADAEHWMVHALAEFDDPRVVDILVDMALTTKSQDVALQATYALSEHDEERVTDALGKILESSESEEVRRAALWALTDREHDAPIELLEKIALESRDVEIRRAAVYALAEAHPEDRAADALVKIIRGTDSDAVRKASLYSILDIDEDRMPVELLKELALGVDHELAKTASYALVEAVDDGRIEGDVLVGVYRDTPIEEVRRAVTYGLLDLEDDKYLPVYGDMLERETATDLRKNIVWAIAEFETDESVKILERVALEDHNRAVRRIAIQALGQIGSDASRSALRNVLNSSQ